MKKEGKELNEKKDARKCISLKSTLNLSKELMQKNDIAVALYYIFIFALSLLILPSFVFADGRTNEPSHQTLFSNVITSYTDGNAVTIADAEGLRVTTGNVGIGTTSPGQKLVVEGSVPRIFAKDSAGAIAQMLAIGNSEVAFGSNSNHPVRILVNDQDVMRITTAGNVGIGTTTPSAKLTVGDGTTAGDQGVRINAPIASEARFEIYKDGDIKWKMYTPASSNDLRFYDGGDRVTFQGGKVGIGTTSPSGSLDVYASDGITRIALFTDNGVGNTQIQANSGTQTLPSYAFDTDTDTGMFSGDTDELKFSTAGAARVMIDPSGNVGIGTIGPGYKLDVAGQIRSSSGGFVFPDNTVQTTAAGGGGGGVGGSGTANYIPKWTDGTTLGNSVIYESAGNVGIGTSGPETPLHLVTTGIDGFRVTGSFTPRIDLYSTNTNGFARNWMLRTSTSVWGDFSIKQSNAHLGDPLNAGTTRFYIRNDGNVGIGTTDTGNILTVLQGSATDPIADAWTTYSSRRWKTNITKLENAMEKVLKLDGVSFNWKADGRHDIGLIAEDAGKIVPEAAAYEDNKVDAKSLDYNKFVPLLIESVKDLNAKTERLEEKNGKLESENIELKARLMNLEYKIGKV